MTLNPYLNFEGDAEEAFRFYHSVFGGEFFIQKMSDAPGSEDLSDEERNRAMHVSITIGKNQFLMASDIVPATPIYRSFVLNWVKRSCVVKL